MSNLSSVNYGGRSIKSLLGLLSSARLTALAFAVSPSVYASSINFLQCKMRGTAPNSTLVLFDVLTDF